MAEQGGELLEFLYPTFNNIWNNYTNIHREIKTIQT